MLCTKLDCKVEMYVDNFLYWLMKKTKERDFKGNDEKFKKKIPLMFDNLRTRGLDKYNQYQKDYAEANRKYMERNGEWRNYELRRLRYLEKLKGLCANLTCSSDEEDEDEDDSADSEVELNESNNGQKGESNDENFNFGSNSSINTVISLSPNPFSQTLSQRYNSYLETESVDIQSQPLSQQMNLIVSNVGNEVVVDNFQNVVDALDIVSSQSFLPESTSTQK